MRRLAAGVGGKTQDLVLVQLGGGGGREVMADDDARLLEMFQVHMCHPPQQIVKHTPGDITHVRGAFAKIIVLHRRQCGRVALRHRVEGEFDVHLLCLNHTDDFVQQRAVFQHEQMGVKNAAVRRFHFHADLVLNFQNFLAGLGERFFESVHLSRQFRVGQLMVRNGSVGFAKHKDFPLAYAG